MKRKGCIYSEITNAGSSTLGRGVRGTNKRIMKSRWVAEIMVNRKRYRFRSTNYDNVRWWLNTMIEKQKKPTRTGINPSFYHNEQPHNFAV